MTISKLTFLSVFLLLIVNSNAQNLNDDSINTESIPLINLSSKLANYGNFDYEEEFDSSLYSFYNRTFKIGTGVGLNTYRYERHMQFYSDTSEHQFKIQGHTPFFTFSEDIIIDNLFSIGYTIGYQYSNIKYDNQSFGTNLFFGAINPRLTIFHNRFFEYYIKMNVGIAYRDAKTDLLPLTMQRILPEKYQLFTGVTIGGVNFFSGEHFGGNIEFSLWSPETVNVGLSYRFLKMPH